MGKQDFKTELIGLEKQYWQALKDQDMAAVMRLTEDPCITAGAQGTSTLDHKTFSTMMKSPAYQLKSFKISDDVQLMMVKEDVAILAYKVREELTVEGKPLTLDAADSSTWVRRNGQWRCALHTESISGDPFGRDRRPAAPV